MSYNIGGNDDTSAGAGGGWGMIALVVFWIVCAYFGIFFDRVQDGM